MRDLGKVLRILVFCACWLGGTQSARSGSPEPEGACVFDGGTCEILSGVECTDAGGSYIGDDTECGGCCTEKGSPGCEVVDCSETVCAADPFCCNTNWDAICADKAGMLCGTLCNPDHYQCYEAKVAPDTPKFEKRDVTLVDQFGPSSALIDKVKNLCNPVDKNDEEIIDPTAHLTCYNIKEFDPQFEQRIVFVNNQFGTLFLKVEKPERLCVPSEKTVCLRICSSTTSSATR